MQPQTDITPMLDPQLVPAFAAAPVLGSVDLATRRARSRAFAAAYRAMLPPPDDLRILDITTPASPSGTAVPLRILAPATRSSTAVLLWFHGGGFASGHHEDEDLIVAPWIRATGCTVVSVGYRLAPEYPHPAASDDGYAALQWLSAGPAELGFVPSRIAVGGISAGAALATATAQRVRDQGGPALAFQLLLVPCADNRSVTPSMRTLVDPRQWHAEANLLAWQMYAGGDGEVSPYAAPGRATDLSGLPPAYVEVAGADPLRDEGIDYATRLMQAGVAVELHVFPGAYHASSYLQPQAEISRRARQEAVEVLRRVLGTAE